jgi:hypothetical protein
VNRLLGNVPDDVESERSRPGLVLGGLVASVAS